MDQLDLLVSGSQPVCLMVISDDLNDDKIKCQHSENALLKTNAYNICVYYTVVICHGACRDKIDHDCDCSIRIV